jgi:hypothetical protein
MIIQELEQVGGRTSRLCPLPQAKLEFHGKDVLRRGPREFLTVVIASLVVLVQIVHNLEVFIKSHISGLI